MRTGFSRHFSNQGVNIVESIVEKINGRQREVAQDVIWCLRGFCIYRNDPIFIAIRHLSVITGGFSSYLRNEW